MDADLSPKGSYLVTCSRQKLASEGSREWTHTADNGKERCLFRFVIQKKSVYFAFVMEKKGVYFVFVMEKKGVYYVFVIEKKSVYFVFVMEKKGVYYVCFCTLGCIFTDLRTHVYAGDVYI